MKALLYLISYSASVAFAVYLSVLSEKQWSPLTFTEFSLSTAEVINIAIVMAMVNFIAQSAGRLLTKGADALASFSLDYFNFLVAYSISILYFLLASSITFSPNIFVYIGIYMTLFAFVLQFAFKLQGESVLRALLPMLLSLFKRVPSLYGAIVLILLVTPLALAVGFVFSREVADAITEVRVKFNRAKDTQWALVPALDQANFRQPMIARFSAQQPNTLYVLERSGDLYQVDYPSGKNKKLVLDIKAKVGSIDAENGALGLVLHPEFSLKDSINHRHLFIYYTSVHDGIQKNIVSRFILDQSKSSIDKEEVQLINLQRLNNGYHNGGSVEFGADGFLYVAVGEGVVLNGKKKPHQALRAAVLRIDVDQQGGDISQPIEFSPLHGITANYFIPKDNPFVNNDAVLDEYWAKGLRNPFRVSFDSHDGTLWAGDTGTAVWEEVNKIVKGGNYLYPYIEGPKTSDFVMPSTLNGQPKHPTYSYRHSAFDRAVIGGVVYRGKELPDLAGTYLFGDNFSGKLYSIPANQEKASSAQLVAQAEKYAQRGISSITYSPTGEVFVTLLGVKDNDSGQLMRLTTASAAEEFRRNSMSPVKEHVYSFESTKSLYLATCARCHGNDGRGQGTDAASFNVAIADFTSIGFQQKRSDRKLVSIIKKGGSANNLSPDMPPWQLVLSNDEVDDLVRYIRTLNN